MAPALDPTVCPRCLGRGAACLCAAVPTVVTRTRFVVLQHLLEAAERSNTARFAALAMPGLELRLHGVRDAPARLEDLVGPATWLLFPGEGAGRPPGPAPHTVVVLDASWSQARRMVQRLPAVRALPRWSLPAVAARPRLRAAPEGGMSTLEALAAAVAALEGPEVAQPLEALHEALCRRQLEARGYVGRMR